MTGFKLCVMMLFHPIVVSEYIKKQRGDAGFKRMSAVLVAALLTKDVLSSCNNRHLSHCCDTVSKNHSSCSERFLVFFGMREGPKMFSTLETAVRSSFCSWRNVARIFFCLS